MDDVKLKYLLTLNQVIAQRKALRDLPEIKRRDAAFPWISGKHLLHVAITNF